MNYDMYLLRRRFATKQVCHQRKQRGYESIKRSRLIGNSAKRRAWRNASKINPPRKHPPVDVSRFAAPREWIWVNSEWRLR